MHTATNPFFSVSIYLSRGKASYCRSISRTNAHTTDAHRIENLWCGSGKNHDLFVICNAHWVDTDTHTRTHAEKKRKSQENCVFACACHSQCATSTSHPRESQLRSSTHDKMMEVLQRNSSKLRRGAKIYYVKNCILIMEHTEHARDEWCWWWWWTPPPRYWLGCAGIVVARCRTHSKPGPWTYP